jgi:flavoprotein
MGQVYATWNSTLSTFTDISSPDLVGSTAGLKWDVYVIAPNVFLTAKISSGTWDILVATRIIF